MDTKGLLKLIGIALVASGLLLLACTIYNEAQMEDNPFVEGRSESVLLLGLTGTAFLNGFVLLYAESRWPKTSS